MEHECGVGERDTWRHLVNRCQTRYKYLSKRGCVFLFSSEAWAFWFWPPCCNAGVGSGHNKPTCLVPSERSNVAGVFSPSECECKEVLVDFGISCLFLFEKTSLKKKNRPCFLWPLLFSSQSPQSWYLLGRECLFTEYTKDFAREREFQEL